ncbi:hypothetical protein MRX96_018780 [Rhipicephalus microplus]
MVQYMKTLSKSKLHDVIALQEPFDRAQLPGYRRTAFIDHSLDISEESDIDHNLIEVVPCIGSMKTGLFVLNVYSPPFKKGPHA